MLAIKISKHFTDNFSWQSVQKLSKSKQWFDLTARIDTASFVVTSITNCNPDNNDNKKAYIKRSAKIRLSISKDYCLLQSNGFATTFFNGRQAVILRKPWACCSYVIRRFRGICRLVL